MIFKFKSNFLKLKSIKRYYFKESNIKISNQESKNNLIEKNDYKDEWEIKNSQNLINKDFLKPILKFQETSFPNVVIKELETIYPQGPSIVQSKSWPLVFGGQDLIVTSHTGSGKTLAYVLPSLEHVNSLPKGSHISGPKAILISPTRELTIQIHEELNKFSPFYKVRTACLYGGSVNKIEQSRQLFKKPDIIVATPGRLIDFLNENSLEINFASYLVIDEADKMLDMGFENQIRLILEKVICKHQTLMWSATWPRRLEKLANDFLNNPIRLMIESDQISANPNVKQEFIFCEWFEKLEKLVKVLSQVENQKIIIFTNTKNSCEFLNKKLNQIGFNTCFTHGGKFQSERAQIIEDFKSGKIQIIISTDILSRGIDISDISTVVNYNFPNSIETYVHRIGRTGRVNKKGNSFSFFTSKEKVPIKQIVELIEQSGQQVPNQFYEMIKKPK